MFHKLDLSLSAALSASWEVWTGEEGVLWWTNKLVRLSMRSPCLGQGLRPPSAQTERTPLVCLRVCPHTSSPLLRAPQAYGAVFVLIGAWVVFRFLGPTLGFYTLKNGFTEVPASLL